MDLKWLMAVMELMPECLKTCLVHQTYSFTVVQVAKTMEVASS